MTNENLVTCRCQHCNKGIEFDASDFSKGENRTVECPHCHLGTIIFVPSLPPISPTNPKQNQSKIVIVSLAVIVCVCIIAGLIFVSHGKNRAITNAEIATNAPVLQPAIAAATEPQPSPPPVPKTEEEQIDALKAKPLLMSSEEKAARDDILKSLLNVQSATSIGVNRDRYGDLLTKALSTLTFEKTKLSTERHENFLMCAAKAIDYYNDANKTWSDYFEYDWMRDQNEALMAQADVDDLRQNGVTVDTTNFRPYENDKTMFYVPFNDCLSLYWQAADVYIEKMKDDVQQ